MKTLILKYPSPGNYLKNATKEIIDKPQEKRISVSELFTILQEVFPAHRPFHSFTRDTDMIYTNGQGLQKRVVTLYMHYLHSFFTGSMESASYASCKAELVAIRHPNDTPNTLRDIEIKLHFNFPDNRITTHHGEQEVTFVYKREGNMEAHVEAYPTWTDTRIFHTLMHNSKKYEDSYPMGYKPLSFHVQ